MFPLAADGPEAQGQHEGPFGVARKWLQQQCASWVCMGNAHLPAPFQSRVGSAADPWSPAQPRQPGSLQAAPAALPSPEPPTWKSP